ncbi:YbhB/YbcL family Raf kinase inhibitor-like protein [Hydrogenovibrio sp. JE_KL2]|uniref:YbhB/YbcL family Raf kinase inhibitor-like protein n=1 Tax=Hydrogenovibrio sp. JE_KL2 TaxID=2651188 RepID=UPI00128AEB4A|nr:YbhB/YbcL family Raf kinase inhibitor-like protein [Hydrogenovibrio sp. JE_KL2]MPQ76643.1 YbhB/YbcL family Raf kinase inhibitor-like protein [Hydrogenovibrio sp. JE_KL2]
MKSPLLKSLVATPLIAFFGNVYAAGMTLTSAEVKPAESISTKQVFNGFGCTGKNVSPSLKWSGEPKGTESFALMVYDPDAPTGSGWWHWVVFNIPKSVHQLPLNAGNPAMHLMPKGVIQSRTDFGSTGYGGPCPPKGDKPHRYQFTIYALKVKSLPLKADTTAATVGYYVHQNMLAKATLQGMYQRH